MGLDGRKVKWRLQLQSERGTNIFQGAEIFAHQLTDFVCWIYCILVLTSLLNSSGFPLNYLNIRFYPLS